MAMQPKTLIASIAGVVILFVAVAAGAHTGHIEHDLGVNAFWSGITHPLTGLDHLFAMVAVGLWSAMTHTSVRKAMLTPLSFLMLLFSGAVLGFAGLRLPAVEPIIIVSLLVLGLLVASRMQLPQWAGSAIVGFFALFHGFAHGSELPASGSAMAFLAGFMLSTLTLHSVGLLAGFQIKHYGRWLSGVLGSGIAAYGVSLMLSM